METVVKEHEIVKNDWREHRKTFLAVLFASFGAAALGSVLGYITLALPSFNKTHSFSMSDVEISVAVSFSSLGALLGGPIGGQLSDTIGRKSAIIYSSAPFVFGWLMIVVSPNIYCLTAGRLLTGLSIGLMESSIPVYIAEISPAKVRGFMGFFFELLIMLGIQYAYAMGTWLSWRWLAVACQVIPAVMLVLMMFVPESPRWLLKRKQLEECITNLQWLRGKDANIEPELKELGSNQVLNSGWNEFCEPYIYRPFRIVAVLSLLQQLVGMATLSQYMVEILTAAGDQWQPRSEVNIVAATMVLGNISSSLFVDRLGRRVVLLATTFILTLSVTGLAVYFTFLHYGNSTVVHQYSYVVFVCMVICQMCYAAGLSCVPFILISELLPLGGRGKGTGLCISIMWFVQFLVSFAFPYGVSLIGYYAVLWIFVAISFFTLIFIFFVVPETCNLTLEQIEKMYAQ